MRIHRILQPDGALPSSRKQAQVGVKFGRPKATANATINGDKITISVTVTKSNGDKVNGDGIFTAGEPQYIVHAGEYPVNVTIKVNGTKVTATANI